MVYRHVYTLLSTAHGVSHAPHTTSPCLACCDTADAVEVGEARERKDPGPHSDYVVPINGTLSPRLSMEQPPPIDARAATLLRPPRNQSPRPPPDASHLTLATYPRDPQTWREAARDARKRDISGTSAAMRHALTHATDARGPAATASHTPSVPSPVPPVECLVPTPPSICVPEWQSVHAGAIPDTERTTDQQRSLRDLARTQSMVPRHLRRARDIAGTSTRASSLRSPVESVEPSSARPQDSRPRVSGTAPAMSIAAGTWNKKIEESTGRTYYIK